MAELRPADAEVLAALRRTSASVGVSDAGGDQRLLTWRASGDLEDTAAVVFRYTGLGLYDHELGPADTRQETTSAQLAREGLPLASTWSVGTRIAWTVEHYEPVLGCRVVTGWTRQEVR